MIQQGVLEYLELARRWGNSGSEDYPWDKVKWVAVYNKVYSHYERAVKLIKREQYSLDEIEADKLVEARPDSTIRYDEDMEYFEGLPISERSKAVLYMLFIQEMKPREVAAALGIKVTSLPTIREAAISEILDTYDWDI